MKKIFEKDFRGKKLIVEHGEVAKQADGAVLVRYGDTVVLSTVVVSKTANVLSDFFIGISLLVRVTPFKYTTKLILEVASICLEAVSL